MDNRQPKIEDDRDSQLGIWIALFVIIITLVFYAIYRFGKSTGRAVLLTGSSDAGKTLIYARLLCSKFVKTHTSVKENVGNIIIHNNSLMVVDIPGHERLRYKFFDEYKSFAKALVYVIDSVSIQKEIRDVAEFLYNLLSDATINKNKPILILCNKQDQTMAKGSTVIKHLLEKEINLLRKTKTSQLVATDASSTNVFLGKVGTDFKFSDLNAKIEFAESNAFNKDPDTPPNIKELNAWLDKII